jgi:hypothetical protein
MKRSSLKLGPAVLSAALLAYVAGAAPCFAVMLDGFEQTGYPRYEPVINDNGDGPPSISIPLYSSVPSSGGVEGTSITPEPSSLLLVSIAAGALGLQRRSRFRRVG